MVPPSSLDPTFPNVALRWMDYLGINPSTLMQDYTTLIHRIWVSPKHPSPTNHMLSVHEHLVDHPLSQSENSLWQKYFTLENVRSIVLKDVKRTFPDVPFFQTPELQMNLTQILCIYCIEREIRYEQGMHELCAVLLYILFHDPTVPEAELLAYAYALFQGLMQLQSSLFKNDTAARLSERFFHVHVRAIDPKLYYHLLQLNIEPHLFGIRWVRLLLSREFPLIQVGQLWEGLFALRRRQKEPVEWLETLSYICATLLVSARTELLTLDYTGCMQTLMHWTSKTPSKELLHTMVEHQRQVKYIVFDLTQRHPNLRPLTWSVSGSNRHSGSLQNIHLHGGTRIP